MVTSDGLLTVLPSPYRREGSQSLCGCTNGGSHSWQLGGLGQGGLGQCGCGLGRWWVIVDGDAAVLHVDLPSHLSVGD